MKTVHVFYLLLVVAVSIYCDNDDDDDDDESTKPHITMRTTKEGPEDCYGAMTNDTLEMLYVLTDKNGDLIQQNTPSTTFSFQHNKKQVIVGFDQGVDGMCETEQRSLVIPPELAYGNKEKHGIPAGSTLFFNITLVKLTRSPNHHVTTEDFLDLA